MKSYVKGLWLIALSLIILSPEVRGQSFGDNPGNWLLNNLRRLPQPNPNWWEDKERMRMLGEAFAKEDRELLRVTLAEANRGNPVSQSKLGIRFANGEGVPKDQVEALKWFRKAAEQGDAWAQFTLGRCYANGVGVPLDDLLAVSWFRKAAEQGDPVAQFDLGFCYYHGKGVPKDFVEAYAYFSIAGGSIDAARQNAGRGSKNQVAVFAHYDQTTSPFRNSVSAKGETSPEIMTLGASRAKKLQAEIDALNAEPTKITRR